MDRVARVLLAVAHGGDGGMQTQVGLLAAGLRDAGVAVTVAAGPGPLALSGVERVELPALQATSALEVARALRAVADDVDADVVHGHGLRLAPMLARCRRPAAVTCHGIDPGRAGPTAAMVRATRVAVAACGEGPKRVLARHGLRSRVLRNAVPPMPAPLPAAEVAERYAVSGSPLCVTPARLSPQKDPLTVVRALAASNTGAGVLLGGGPLDQAVRDEVTSLGVHARIAVTGWSPDARSVLAAADVLLLGSRWEGQPTVLLEAMASSVAIVSTACTGVTETVVDGATALLAPVGDHRALARAIDRAADPALRAALTTAARDQLGCHQVAAVAAHHLDAYARLLEGRWLDPLAA